MAHDPKIKFSSQRRHICPKGTGVSNKGRRQRKQGKGAGTRERSVVLEVRELTASG